MDAYFTQFSPSFNRWLATLAASLVLWGLAYAHASTPAARGLPARSYALKGAAHAGRPHFAALLASTPEEAAMLRYLAAPATEPAAPVATVHLSEAGLVLAAQQARRPKTSLSKAALPSAHTAATALGQTIAE